MGFIHSRLCIASWWDLYLLSYSLLESLYTWDLNPWRELLFRPITTFPSPHPLHSHIIAWVQTHKVMEVTHFFEFCDLGILKC